LLPTSLRHLILGYFTLYLAGALSPSFFSYGPCFSPISLLFATTFFPHFSDPRFSPRISKTFCPACYGPPKILYLTPPPDRPPSGSLRSLTETVFPWRLRCGLFGPPQPGRSEYAPAAPFFPSISNSYYPYKHSFYSGNRLSFITVRKQISLQDGDGFSRRFLCYFERITRDNPPSPIPHLSRSSFHPPRQDHASGPPPSQGSAARVLFSSSRRIPFNGTLSLIFLLLFIPPPLSPPHLPSFLSVC